jgi:fructose-bisphosphate aldolase class II
MALHGGSGLSDDQFRDLISRGCAKVNISTALKQAYIDAHRDFLAENPDCHEPLTLMAFVSSRVSMVAQGLIKVFGSEGRVAIATAYSQKLSATDTGRPSTGCSPRRVSTSSGLKTTTPRC